MLATCHNHTVWSDGRATAAAMHDSAVRSGVDLLGISDHYCVYPDGTSPDWALQPNEIEAYRSEIASLNGVAGVEVLVGLEFDWFEGHEDRIRPHVERIPLDYRIGAIHHIASEQFDVDPAYWERRSPEERDALYINYWDLVREMASSGLFDIAAHLDLPKKLGFPPSSDLSVHIDAALDAIAAHRLVVELNTAGFGKRCADGYPSLAILQKCRQRDIPVTLSSDGHIPEHLLFEFERGLARLREAGFAAIVHFRGRERFSIPLDQALRSGRPAKS